MYKLGFLAVLISLIVTATSSVLKPEDLVTHPKDLLEQGHIGDLSNGERIVNGEYAELGQFPYQVVMIFTGKSGSWLCGGSIINNNYILTAGHCGYQAYNVTIYMGTIDRRNPQTTVVVEGKYITVHPKYNPSYLWNDICIIQTPDITFSDTIKPVALPSKSKRSSTYAGNIAIASGFGKTADTDGSAATLLSYTPLQIATNNVCSYTYTRIIVTKNVVCTYTEDKHSICQGDSGGPLVLASTGELIGVSSFVSSRGCESELPAGFTRVTSYLDWIAETTGISLS